MNLHLDLSNFQIFEETRSGQCRHGSSGSSVYNLDLTLRIPAVYAKERTGPVTRVDRTSQKCTEVNVQLGLAFGAQI